MQEFDYIIIGAGCSGLSLVYEMDKKKLLNNKTCAIFDKRKNFKRDKIWSYWNTYEHSFKDCLLNDWSKVIIKKNDSQIILDCSEYKYQSVDSKKFYKKVLSKIKKNPNIKIYLNHPIVKINEKNKKIMVKSNNAIFSSKLVFSSSLNFKDSTQSKLYQHFLGCEVLFKKKINLPMYPTLMDFNCPQNNWVHFFYCLPMSNNKLFIETTWISDVKNFKKEKYNSEIDSYIKQNLNYKGGYKLGYCETGSIPMFHYKEKKFIKSVIDIGIASNLTRLSTGYTFLNIQKSTHSIVSKLKKDDVLINEKQNKKYNFLDKIFLKVLLEKKNTMKDIFFNLFRKNSSKTIIQFLSNQSTFITDLKIIFSMPKLIFLKKLFSN